MVYSQRKMAELNRPVTHHEPQRLAEKKRAQRAATEKSRCRSCGAAVYWVVWESGKKMPINADPHPEGNVLVDVDKDANTLWASTYRGEGKHRNRYLSHFSTCPNAAKHRAAK